MKLLIVVQHRLALWNVPAWFGQKLAQDFPQLQIAKHNRYEGIQADLCDAEVVFTLSLRPEQFDLCRNLRWIHSPSAAVHQFMFPELINSNVVLTNSAEVHGPVVAEHVMALIFALAKKIPQAALFQQKHIWGQDAMWNEGAHLREIAGATLGGVEAVFPPSGLDELLNRCDYIVLAAPLTGATQKLINAERLAGMKPEACLINVGRGRLVDEVALADALHSKRIAGAALDVFDKEPLSPDSPLWSVPNLLITPHTAGLTEKLWQRHYQLFSDNVRRYLAHQPLRFVVDKHMGY
jgi:phosphoglycerate dehydrogenase-like enzyme